MLGGQDKYLVQTGIVRNSWAWEIRIQETPFGSILIYEYWKRDESLVWALQSYSTGEYTSMLLICFINIIYVS